jgi:hypothetical protein
MFCVFLDQIRREGTMVRFIHMMKIGVVAMNSGGDAG